MTVVDQDRLLTNLSVKAHVLIRAKLSELSLSCKPSKDCPDVGEKETVTEPRERVTARVGGRAKLARRRHSWALSSQGCVGGLELYLNLFYKY